MSDDSLWPHRLQHTRLSCPSPTPRACSNSCLSSQWCHPTILSSVIPFSCLQPFPVSGSFPMSQFFTSGGQSTGVSASASVLPMNIQDRFPLGWTGWSSLQSKGLWRIPGMAEPGGLLSMGPHRVRHDWSDSAAAAAPWKKSYDKPRQCIKK